MSVLVQKSVRQTLLEMAFPMLAGTFAMNAYSLTDAWFVAQLGTLPLAAMGFIMPVIMLLTCVAGGIGTGITTLVSHAIGRHDQDAASRVVIHGLALTLGITTLITIAGYLSIDFIFARLGADAKTLPLIGDYMSTWYFGAIFMSLPMLGNGILISSGDSKAASQFMILGTILNAMLNPILIFGFPGFPPMGIRGSAMATVIAQAVSTAWLFHLLRHKHQLLKFEKNGLAGCLESFRKILSFGIPSSLSMILMPVSAGIITSILSRFGPETVAACGAAGRIEMFAFVIPMALGMSLTPFISQNYGAGRMDRIREAFTISTRFALIYGGGVAIVFFLCAPWFASFFTADPAVASTLVIYIRIISFGYGMMEVHRYCGFVLTGLHKPAFSTALNVIRALILLIPLACLGAHFGGVRGVFCARLATDLLAGSIGLICVRCVLRARQRNETCPS
ncbi:MAG: MATE family efflux transporter [Verrucomicrobiae bacterium]|nr:MATE family efflux transporter [Verrucomicrobiae bacterium]